MEQISTTLNRIRAHNPCKDGWAKLLTHLGKTKADDERLPFAVIVDAIGLDDAIWCCRAEPQHAQKWGLFTIEYVEAMIACASRRFARDEAADAAFAAAKDALRARFITIVGRG